ncbi:uncharacterized protein FN964_005608 isoform 4-T7 [Alca torda]
MKNLVPRGGWVLRWFLVTPLRDCLQQFQYGMGVRCVDACHTPSTADSTKVYHLKVLICLPDRNLDSPKQGPSLETQMVEDETETTSEELPPHLREEPPEGLNLHTAQHACYSLLPADVSPAE